MYLLEGNIGAGKSTLVKLIGQEIPHVMIAQEPVDWQRPVEGKSLLAHFYEDPSRWAYTMETFTMLSRIRESADDNQCLISERSVYSGYYCFARNSYESGFMSLLEWNMCTNWFNFLIPRLCFVPQGFIYLRVSPECAFERVKKRSRHAEATVPLTYLEQIHNRHDRFLIDRQDVLPALSSVPVLTLSTDGEFETDSAERNHILDQVRAFVALHTSSSRAVFDESIAV